MSELEGGFRVIKDSRAREGCLKNRECLINDGKEVIAGWVEKSKGR